MKPKTKILIFAVISAFLLLLPFCASASEADPLISLSYLTEIFAPQLKAEIAAETDEMIAEAIANAIASTTSEYEFCTLYEGQRIFLAFDGEMIFRGGEAHFISADPTSGLTDLTSGEMIYSGAPLSAGHIYVSAEEDASAYILITGEKAAVMLRGENEIR